MNAAMRIAVARIAKRLRGVPVIFVEEVSEPEDDGNYVRLELRCEDALQAVVLLTTEGFYDNLGKVMRKTLPRVAGVKLS